MKKIILLFLICTNVFSQNCKFEKNEVDEFTGSKIIKLKEKLLAKTSMTTGVSFQIQSINDQKFIEFTYTSSQVFSFDKNKSMIMLKTNDGEIIEIPFEKNDISDVTYGSYFYSKQKVILTQDLIIKLENKPIVKFRLYTSNGFVEEEVKSKNSLSISDDIKCLNKI